MPAVTIHKEDIDPGAARFRAIGGEHASFGRTAGEALDNFNAQHGDSSALIVIQQMQSDLYFSEEKYQRMRDLLDQRDTLSETERFELEGLVKAEMAASAKRTEALADALGR